MVWGQRVTGVLIYMMSLNETHTHTYHSLDLTPTSPQAPRTVSVLRSAVCMQRGKAAFLTFMIQGLGMQ